MINVAIVEDQKKEADLLCACLRRYSEQHKENFDIAVFENGIEFLTKYQANFDIIFMDIELPDMNGMSVAHKLRSIDNSSILIFVTNISKYAINGYEVGAMDYILKPLNYPAFELKINKAVASCKKNRDNKIHISTREGYRNISASSIIYIESRGHRIEFHTENGEYIEYGTMKNLESLLPETMFFRCNSCYIINFSFISSYNGYTVKVGNEELIISRARKKQFMEKLHRYYVSMGRD